MGHTLSLLVCSGKNKKMDVMTVKEPARMGTDGMFVTTKSYEYKKEKMTFFASGDIQVGDRVKYMLKGSIVLNCGETGTVLGVRRKPGYTELDVCWDKEDPRKYPLAGCKDKHGWVVLYPSVKKIL